MSGRYARPVLCRLCRFPASDGGVPVSQLDRCQLSEWCLRMMDTELDLEGLEKDVFCRFCISDARFESQFASKTETFPGIGLLGNCNVAKWSEKYYFENVIQPCAVRINFLSPKEILADDADVPGFSSIKQPRHRAKMYQCPYCLSMFKIKAILARHVSKFHRDIPTFKCQFCYCFLKTEAEKQKHIRRKHKLFKSCIFCIKFFNSRCDYLDHMKLNHKDKAIQCTVYNCGLCFRCEADLEEHAEKKHKKTNVQCVYCKRLVKNIAFHLSIHHKKDVIIRCDVTTCSTYFLTQQEKQSHMLYRHEAGRIQCIYCEKSFFSMSILWAHINTKHETEKIKCSYPCFTYFLSEEDRKKHEKEAHKLKEIVGLECVYCKKTYIGPGSLRAHTHKKHFAVQIKCKWRGCAVYFLTNEDRDQHFDLMHSEAVKEKKFQCDLCDFKTSLRIYMERHYINSHAQLEFKCPQCPIVLGSRPALRLHLRVHEEKKKCNFCKKQISYRGFRLHSFKRRCKKCNYLTKCAADRSRHVLSCKLQDKISSAKVAESFF